jgi:hypothetical protein
MSTTKPVVTSARSRRLFLSRTAPRRHVVGSVGGDLAAVVLFCSIGLLVSLFFVLFCAGGLSAFIAQVG